MQTDNSSNRRRQLAILLLSIFVSTIGLGILNPLVSQLFAGKLALFPNLGYGVYGILVAVFPLAQFCSSFVLAGASDRMGRKQLLLLSLWGTAAGYLLLIVALLTRNLPLLFGARIIDGITGGNVGITQAAIADITPKEQRTAKLGLIGGAFGLGLIVGPVLGGTFATWFSPSAPFIIAALVSVINALLIWRYLPSMPAVSRASNLLATELWSKLVEYVHSARLRSVLSASFLYQLGMAAANSFFPVFLIERFHFGAEQIGFFYGYIGVVYATNQFVLVPWLSRRWRPEQVLSVSIPVAACMLTLYALTFYEPIIFVAGMFFTMANATNQANLNGLISTSADADEQGKILGLNSSLFALGQTIMPPLAGLIATGVSGGLPMLVASICMIASIVCLSTLRSPHRLQTEAIVTK